MNLNEIKSFFFVGIAGTGMSAIAQYLRGLGKTVSGSDRLFSPTEKMEIQLQFEKMGIGCHFQDGSGIDEKTDVVVVSTAIEQTNVEYQKALSLNIPVVKRSEILAMIANSTKTIAVGGTSGKSTTTAMIFHILEKCGKSPSLITGAGLASLQRKGLPGNAYNGNGDWLVIEADESDGSIVGYKPEISVLLNMERDHKEFDELIQLFATFKSNTRKAFVVNYDCDKSRSLSENPEYDFSANGQNVGFFGTDFIQKGFSISFTVNGIPCTLPLIGRHNMENALAAMAVCHQAGVDVKNSAEALSSFEGIYRRTQLVGSDASRKIYVIDDFAHNPSEVACAIKACQAVASHVLAYFQPHGFGPLRFMHKELAEEVAAVLRPSDVFFVGDVYYAGGTVNRDITADVVSDDVQKFGKNAVYARDKSYAEKVLLDAVSDDCVVLIMGARDPHLTDFAKSVFDKI
ncbi:MAG: UDP-N-acetylmuramate--alanine ligase [Bacteroidales bacterium]|nr:UDP-N-acetylmuramate--alanine ligase [Bacteroidales bacterium]